MLKEFGELTLLFLITLNTSGATKGSELQIGARQLIAILVYVFVVFKMVFD